MARSSPLNTWLKEVSGLWDVFLEKLGGAYYRARPDELKPKRAQVRRAISF